MFIVTLFLKFSKFETFMFLKFKTFLTANHLKWTETQIPEEGRYEVYAKKEVMRQ